MAWECKILLAGALEVIIGYPDVFVAVDASVDRLMVIVVRVVIRSMVKQNGTTAKKIGQPKPCKGLPSSCQPGLSLPNFSCYTKVLLSAARRSSPIPLFELSSSTRG